MYTALYRTERPEVFSEMLGQEHIVRILRNQIASDTVGHAYLFCGTRGTGKTTTARLLAKAVNCTSEGERPCGVCENCRAIQNGRFMDVIEIDAASNRSVNDIRDLRDSVNFPPITGRRKVYIIDEVHMLTPEAFNALLKTLEEPPESIMFILATTDPQKLPQTILSRCMRFDFRRVPENRIAERMEEICAKRGIRVTDGALRLLAANADGSVRDGLSLLDQCIAGDTEELTREQVLEYLGTVSDDFFLRLTERVMLKDAAGALLLLDEVIRDGKDVKLLLGDWLSHYRSLLIAKYIKDPEDMLNMSRENVEKLARQSAAMELPDLNDGIITLAKTISDARYSTQPRTLMELAIVTLATGLGTGYAPRSGGSSAGQSFREPMKRSADRIRAAAAPEAERPKAQAPQPAPQRPEAPAPGPAHREAPAPAPQQEAPAPEAKPAPETAEDRKLRADLEDLEELWQRVWDRIPDDGTSTFGMVMMNTQLAGVNDREFKVLAGNDVVKEMAEKERRKIMDAMRELTGKHLDMVIRAAGSGGRSPARHQAKTAPSREADPEREKREHIARQLAEDFDLKTRLE